MAAVPNPSDLTRHQLDELDALLQRMLALPLNGSGAVEVKPAVVPATTAAQKWRIDTPHPAPSLPATLQAPQVLLEPVAWKPASMPVSYSIPARPPQVEVAAEVVDRPTSVPLFGPPPRMPNVEIEPRTLRGVDAPPVVAKVPMPPPATAPIELSKVPSEPVPLSIPRGTEESVPVLAWPLFACNWTIETFLSLLGPLGHGVTAPPVKNLLALCGMLLLAAAGMWCARGLGYVAW